MSVTHLPAPARLLLAVLVATGLLVGVAVAGAKPQRGDRATKAITWTKTLPTPSGTAFTGGGSDGDGYDVFFDDAGNVFNVWHHDGNGGGVGGAVDCHTRSGTSCGAGWPFKVAPLHTDSQATGWVDDDAKHLWFPTNKDDGTVGFACLDIANIAAPGWCGGTADAAFRALGTETISTDPKTYQCSSGSGNLHSCAAGLAALGGKIYTVGAGGGLYCLESGADSGKGAACAGQPYTLAGITPARIGIRITAVAGRVYVTDFTAAGCFDPATNKACAGWQAVKKLTSFGGDAMVMGGTMNNASGDPVGVCFNPASCYTFAGGPLVLDPALLAAITSSTAGKGFWAMAANGPQVYWGFDSIRNSMGTLNCWDQSTSATCTGFPIKNVSGYSVVADPYNDTCVWGNADDGKIISYSSNGQAGCVLTPTTTRFYPGVSCSQGAVSSWTSFQLTDPKASVYTAAKLTVYDADGTPVKSGGKTWKDLALKGTRTVSLADLSPADTGQNPTFAVKFTKRSGTDSVAAKVKFSIATGDQCGKSGGGGSSSASTSSPIKAKATKTGSRQVPAGGTFSVDLRATNSGTKAAKKTKIVFRAPAGFSIVSARGATITGRTATWKVGTLKPRASATGTVVLRAARSGRARFGFTVVSSLGTTRATAATVFVTGSSVVTG